MGQSQQLPERVVPSNVGWHTGHCKACALAPVDLAELERLFVSFTPTTELARLFDIPYRSVIRHCAFFSLTAIRAQLAREGSARMVELGLDVERDDVTPDHALIALSQLHRADASERAAQAPPANGEGIPAGPVSWERQVRLTIRGKAGDDSRQLGGAGGDSKGEPDELTYHGKTIEMDADQPARAAWPEP